MPMTNGVPAIPRTSPYRTTSGSAEKPTVNGVKTESSMAPSPAPAAVQLSVNSTGSLDPGQSPNPPMMPPPLANLTARPPSGSPHPQSYTSNHYTSSGYSATSQFEASRRQSGKGRTAGSAVYVAHQLNLCAEALITNLSISTHPGLKIDKHFHLDIPPSPSTTQQSITITLPSSHYFLQFVPTLASSVMHRPYKTFVTVNNNRIASTPQRPDESEPRKPLYECRVAPGMNRIEVEMVAGLPRGVAKVGAGPDLEIEKITIFAHMVKS